MKKIPFRIKKGFIEPADQYAVAEMRRRKYSIGDIVFCVITKPRNPRFFRLAHALGKLCSENIEDFSGMDSHACLKRLQLESGHGVEELLVNLPKVGKVIIKQAKSMSFESMKEEEFRELMLGICRHISEQYWHDLTPEKIEQMAEVMVDE